MPLIQQIKSIPSVAFQLNEHPYLNHISTAAIVTLQIVALVAGQVFALLASLVLMTAIAAYLQDRIVTRLIAAAETFIIAGVSLAILFPPYAAAALGCTIAVGTCCYAYTLYRVLTNYP